jgi:hypothetical protein
LPPPLYNPILDTKLKLPHDTFVFCLSGPFVGACGAVLRLFISQRREGREGRKGEEKFFVRERGVKLTSLIEIFIKSQMIGVPLCFLLCFMLYFPYDHRTNH